MGGGSELGKGLKGPPRKLSWGGRVRQGRRIILLTPFLSVSCHSHCLEGQGGPPEL